MRYPYLFRVLIRSPVLLFEIKAAAYQKHQLLTISRQVLGKLGLLFGEPLHSAIIDPKVIIDVEEGKLCPFAGQIVLINISEFTVALLRRNMIHPMCFMLSHLTA